MPGIARVRSIASFPDPSLEGLQRGDEPFRAASIASQQAIDIARRKRQWLASNGGATLDIENRLYPIVRDMDRDHLEQNWGSFWQ